MSEVNIELNGKSETLRCSLKAAKIISGSNGGFQGALGRLSGMDLEAYIIIVAAGMGKKPAEVEEAVYATGLPDLTESLTQFVLLLANAGRPLSRGAGEGEA